VRASEGEFERVRASLREFRRVKQVWASARLNSL